MKKLVYLLFFVCFGYANAQSPTSVNRKGLLFGASLGASNLHLRSALTTNTTGPGINWKVGYVLTPRFAVLLNGAVSIYENNTLGRNRKRDFGGVFPSVQYWPSRKIWILGGAGLGTDAPVFYDLHPENKEETKYYSGLGGIAAVGYEFYQRGNFSIDLQTRVNYSNVTIPTGKLNGLSVGLLVGFTFY